MKRVSNKSITLNGATSRDVSAVRKQFFRHVFRQFFVCELPVLKQNINPFIIFLPGKVWLTFQELKMLTNLYLFFLTTCNVVAKNVLLLIANTMVGVIMTVNIPKSYQ
jgi:hypothetical protein